jgi:hypothetical protein
MRLALLHRILEAIDESHLFKQADFEITHKISSGAHALTVTYRAYPAYSISATVVDGVIQGGISPGEIGESEHFRIEGQDDFLKLVRQWLEWIHEELLARPLVRQIEHHGIMIDLLVDRWETLGSAYFSSADGAELRARLDRIEADLAGRLGKLALDDTKLRARLKQVESDVAGLRDTATLERRSRIRRFGRRCAKWIRDSTNRAILKDGMELARKFIGPGPPV